MSAAPQVARPVCTRCDGTQQCRIEDESTAKGFILGDCEWCSARCNACNDLCLQDDLTGKVCGECMPLDYPMNRYPDVG